MFSERIKEVRESKGLSQTIVAEKLGVSKQSVANWENGNVMPSIDMLIKISRYFNVSSDYLLGMENKKIINVSDLTLEEVSHIQAIVDDIKSKK